jgi:hypothetical protein
MRKYILRSLLERLRDCFESGNRHATLRERARDETAALLRTLNNSLDDLEVLNAVGMLYRMGHQVETAEREVPDFDYDGPIAIPHASPFRIIALKSVPEEVREFLDEIEAWPNRTSTLINRDALTGSLAAVDGAIKLLRRVVSVTADADSIPPIPLTEVSVVLNHRFEHFGGPVSFDRVLAIGQDVLDAASPLDNAMLMQMASDFTYLYLAKDAHTKEVDARDMVVSYSRRVLEALSDGQVRASIMSTLAVPLRHRGKRVENIENLDEAVDPQRQPAEMISSGFDGWLSTISGLEQAQRAPVIVGSRPQCKYMGITVLNSGHQRRWCTQ